MSSIIPSIVNEKLVSSNQSNSVQDTELDRSLSPSTTSSRSSTPYRAVVSDNIIEKYRNQCDHKSKKYQGDKTNFPTFTGYRPDTMGGLSIPHHGLSAAFHSYHPNGYGNTNQTNAHRKSPGFILPAQFYKSLFASAVQLHQKSPVDDGSDRRGMGRDVVQPFPRNLLFSCADRSPNSDADIEEKLSVPEEKTAVTAFAWNGDTPLNVISSAPSNSTILSNNNNDTTTSNNNNTTNGHTTLNETRSSDHQTIVSPPATNQSSDQTEQNGQPLDDSSPSGCIIDNQPTNSNSVAAAAAVAAVAVSGLTTMPVGGVQGQNPTQGLVHWMSAVMAEHMTSNSHHDPTVGMHYMWNGGVDQCGQHTKEIDYGGWPVPRNHMSMKQGYEAKMNEHHQNNLQKAGHLLDDGRLDPHHATVGHQSQMSLYGAVAAGALHRSGSSNGSSPGGHPHPHHHHVGHHPGTGTPAALLVVPQPINATKIGAGLTNGGPPGRKYQCKMCPQIFSSKADLQLHTQIHMREAKPYKCSQCSKAFANSSYLSQHTRIHLGIKPYRCEICQRKFTQLSHLQQHIRTHTGDKPYKCRHPGCQKAFSQLSNLQSHSRCHQTDKPYKCNSCYKCFSDEPSLLEHIPKHKESKHLKTHICQYCGKSYTQETYLSKHMQKHAERTDKRPPISNTGPGASTTGLGLSGRNLPSLNTPLPPAPSNGTDHPYWPKVSPDSVASISEVMQHQPQHQPSHHDFGLAQHQNNIHTTDLQAHHHQHQQQQQHQQHLSHHRMIDHQQQQQQQHRDDVGEDLVVNRQANLLSPPSSSTPAGAIVYDTITKAATTNSAFTPINSMTPHINSLGHPMAQRPYLYDAISFPPNSKSVTQNTNSFPNQLISLHQIRNYAHQPAGLMTGEHLLGVSVGAGGKDKG